MNLVRNTYNQVTRNWLESSLMPTNKHFYWNNKIISHHQSSSFTFIQVPNYHKPSASCFISLWRTVLWSSFQFDETQFLLTLNWSQLFMYNFITMTVVYLCIKIYSMHCFFTLPGWRHKCISKKWVSHFGLVFGEGMETNSASGKVKKERRNKILFKNYVYTQ